VLRVAAALAFAAGVSAAPAPPSRDATLFDLRVVRANGAVATLREVAGDAHVVFAFWATYCPPCEAEVPTLNHAAERWRARGVRVVGVAIETDGARVDETRERWGIHYDVVRVAPDQDEPLDRLLPRGVPTTAFTWHGSVEWSDVVLEDKALDGTVSKWFPADQ
jgi:thiol-disulfide isomerase/thioredoxin